MTASDALNHTPTTNAALFIATEKEMTLMTDDQTTQTQIPVQGMAWNACARRLEKALAETSGVSEAAVDFDREQASVAFHPEVLDKPALEKRIQDAGFQPAPAAE